MPGAMLVVAALAAAAVAFAQPNRWPLQRWAEAHPGDPLAQSVPAGEQPKWPPITANDYLQERLREIKLV